MGRGRQTSTSQPKNASKQSKSNQKAKPAPKKQQRSRSARKATPEKQKTPTKVLNQRNSKKGTQKATPTKV